MSDDTDVLIRRKEADLLPLCSRMEELRLEFMKQVAVLAAEWYDKTAKSYVAKYPDIMLSKSEEKIARMKTQINQLIQSTEGIVNVEFNNPQIWWHLNPRLHDSFDQYLQVADKYPEILDHAVRHVLGRLGVVLEEHGYHVATSGNAGAYQEFWFEHPNGTGSIVPYYPHLLKWSEQMQETIRKYNAQYTKAIVLFNEIEKLKDEKKKQQAMALWDSA